jgi:hypothetical protein
VLGDFEMWHGVDVWFGELDLFTPPYPEKAGKGWTFGLWGITL